MAKYKVVFMQVFYRFIVFKYILVVPSYLRFSLNNSKIDTYWFLLPTIYIYAD